MIGALALVALVVLYIAFMVWLVRQEGIRADEAVLVSVLPVGTCLFVAMLILFQQPN